MAANNIKVVIDPYVALSILDHHQRRGDEENQVRGILLGSKAKGMLKITNFVPTLSDGAFLELTQRCCPGDSTLGWYATDPNLASEVDRAPNTRLFVAIHLPTETHPSISFKAFHVEKITVAGREIRSFREAPCEVAATSAPSAVAVDTIVRQLCPEVADAADPSAVPSVSGTSTTNNNSKGASKVSSSDAAFAEFQQLRRNLKQAQLYCEKAADGKISGDAGFGRRLSATLLSDLNTLALAPNLDADIENTAQDSLMLSYIMKLLAQKVAQLRTNYHETLEDLIEDQFEKQQQMQQQGEGEQQQQQQQTEKQGEQGMEKSASQ